MYLGGIDVEQNDDALAPLALHLRLLDCTIVDQVHGGRREQR